MVQLLVLPSLKLYYQLFIFLNISTVKQRDVIGLADGGDARNRGRGKYGEEGKSGSPSKLRGQPLERRPETYK
jgi:hypothetical protein